jgi:hypothetical protein
MGARSDIKNLAPSNVKESVKMNQRRRDVWRGIVMGVSYGQILMDMHK